MTVRSKALTPELTSVFPAMSGPVALSSYTACNQAKTYEDLHDF